MLMIPQFLEAGVSIEPRYQEPQGNWVAQQNNQEIGEFYVSQDGLYCANQVYQIYQNGMYIPGRRCRMPDQSWHLLPF